MYDFFVAFMGVFLSGQATSQLFQFSTSKQPYEMSWKNPLLTLIQGITKGKNAANYMFWLHGLEPTVQETPQNRDNGPKSGGPISLDRVRFSYPLRPEATVLKDVDLEVRLDPESPAITKKRTYC